MATAPIVVVATSRDARVERGERAGEGRVVRARGRGDAGARERRRDAPEARIDAHRRPKRRGEEHAVDPDRGSERTDVRDAGGWRGGGDDEDDAGGGASASNGHRVSVSGETLFGANGDAGVDVRVADVGERVRESTGVGVQDERRVARGGHGTRGVGHRGAHAERWVQAAIGAGDTVGEESEGVVSGRTAGGIRLADEGGVDGAVGRAQTRQSGGGGVSRRRGDSTHHRSSVSHDDARGARGRVG